MKIKSLIIMLFLACLLCVIPVRVKALDNINNNSYAYILADSTTAASGDNSEGLVKKYNVCDEDDIKNFIDTYWKVLVIAAPGLLIMMISIDFFKAVMSSDEDLIKKAANNAIKRTAAMIILLMLPYILRMIFSWAGMDFCI